MKQETKDILNRKLPDWAVTTHPSKSYLSVINPMVVIETLNEAFGIDGWQFKTREVSTEKVTDKKYVAAVHGTLLVKEYDIHIEQFGGSDNGDLGDALKGGATDSLTKCASYLGIGASIYKGKGNVEPPKPPMTTDEACAKLAESTTVEQLETVYKSLPASVKTESVIAKAKEVKANILETITE